MLKKAKYFLVKKPLGRTIGFFASVIVSGILCGTFVTEITQNGKIIWSLSFNTKSLYLILILLFGVYLYNRELSDEYNRIMNFSDKNFCKAYLRDKSIDKIAERLNKDLESGKPLDPGIKEFGEFLRDFME